ncbi:MAG TPA: hypothetical protein VE913_10705, partial [Longimicrobium sp.]|nr:hypothetical protein [Longimicrobium sp.]
RVPREAMTTREKAIEAIEALPGDATLDEIVSTLRGLEQEPLSDAPADLIEPFPEGGLWDFLAHVAGTVEMPADWSSEHDHYLYGTPKRSSAA